MRGGDIASVGQTAAGNWCVECKDFVGSGCAYTLCPIRNAHLKGKAAAQNQAGSGLNERRPSVAQGEIAPHRERF
jgi:hypothetical protein